MKGLSLFIILSITFAACSNQDIENEKDNQTDNIPVNINVRSSETNTDDEFFPISVFIFNEEGVFIAKQEVDKEEKSFTTKLKEGNYSISAFSGLDNTEFSYPESPVFDDIIEIKNLYSEDQALMSGHKDIELSQSCDLTIPIKYCVSAISFSFSEVPSDVTEVSLSISPISNGYTFSGRYSGETSKIQIDCTQSDGLWKAGPIYAFPSESNTITLSISVRRESDSETYNYTYSNSLEPAVPYNFKGRYNDGLTVNGSFEIEGWNPGIDIDYDLVPDSPTEGEDNEGGNNEEGNQDNGETTDNDETNITTIYSDNLPEENSIWKSFYVWTTKEISPTEIEALIISPKQWPKILAADAKATLDWYEEDGISDWRTFTEEETRAFYKAFSGSSDELGALNKLLSDNGHNYFYCYEGERYLCKNAEYSFCLNGALRITQVGEEATYYLRPVKTIRIKLQEAAL